MSRTLAQFRLCKPCVALEMIYSFILSPQQITWLEGHSLAQTVFTCLYIHNPDFIEDPAMKAFALGILKICDIAREKVNKAAVFEEVKKPRNSLAVLPCCR